MKFFGRILIFTLTVIFMTACREKEEKYGLNIISPSFQQVYDSISTGDSGDKSVLASASDYRQALNDETIKSIESVTVRDDNISTETAREIIRICEKERPNTSFRRRRQKKPAANRKACETAVAIAMWVMVPCKP